MKNSNSTGIIIIVGVLAFAVMKAFDISFNLANIKIMGSVSVGIIVAMLIFFSMQSKKSDNPEHYIEPEPEEDYNSRYGAPEKPPENVTPNPQSYQHYQQTPEEEYNNRYGAQVSPPVYNPPAPPVVTHYTQPEEDNRWS